MKKKICGLLAAISLTLLAGFVGGIEMETLTFAQGTIGSMLSLVVFFVTLVAGGVIE